MCWRLGDCRWRRLRCDEMRRGSGDCFQEKCMMEARRLYICKDDLMRRWGHGIIDWLACENVKHDSHSSSSYKYIQRRKTHQCFSLEISLLWS